MIDRISLSSIILKLREVGLQSTVRDKDGAMQALSYTQQMLRLGNYAEALWGLDYALRCLYGRVDA